MTVYSNSLPLVSVCIAVYNGEKYVEEAVKSVINQTYNNLEVLVLNDASTDGTLELLTQLSLLDSRVKVLSNECNIGYLKSFNRNLKRANGDLICFVDADDWIDKSKIEQQVRCFIESNNQKLGLVGTFIVRTDSFGNRVGIEEYPTTSEGIRTYLRDNDDVCLCGSSVMITAGVLAAMGGYREYFDGCPAEDYDWIRRISEHYDCVNLRDYLYFYRFAENSLTRKVHYSAKARFANKITKFLAEQRSSLGYDSLENPDNQGLDNYLAELECSILNQKAGLYKATSIQHAINGDFRKSYYDFKLCIKENVDFISLIKLFSVLLVINVLPNKILLSLKNIFKLKSISSKV